jgi:hypothetical protein
LPEKDVRKMLFFPTKNIRDRRSVRSHVMEPQHLRKFLGLGLAGVGALEVAGS